MFVFIATELLWSRCDAGYSCLEWLDLMRLSDARAAGDAKTDLEELTKFGDMAQGFAEPNLSAKDATR